MLIEERQARLAELLARQGMSALDSLAEQLGVSHSTVRRDVEAMVEKNLVRRTHGGVIWLGDSGKATARSYAFDQRLNDQLEAKRQIARAAADLVEPGQTVLIDGGTTSYYLARELVGRPLQLVTNSLPIAQLFLNDDKVELILTGGLLYPRYGVLLGPGAETMLENIHASLLFLSVAGIYQGQLYNQNLLLVQSERRMMAQAQQVILLADHAKFGQQALVRLCELRGNIHTVVSDPGLNEAERHGVREAGCKLILGK
jgi:DeoR/GlpR family transcriptional regulator of sugar metabolism